MNNKTLAIILACLLGGLILYFALKPSVAVAPSTPVVSISSSLITNSSISTISSAPIVSSSSLASTKTVANTGDKVGVNYVGKFQDGKVFDTSLEAVAKQSGLYMTGRNYGPLNFTLGGGEMIKGFDKAVLGMKLGETKTVSIAPADGYGESNPALIKSLPLSEFKQAGIEAKVGDYVPVSVGVDCLIKAVDTQNVTIDCNSPMAGKTLNFDITLVSIN